MNMLLPPVWRWVAAPQYFILNLAGSGVSSKVANILAHSSQLLEEGDRERER